MSRREYEDFYLIIAGQVGAYTVEAQAPGQVGIPPVPFVYELTPDLAEKLQIIEEGNDADDEMEAVGAILFEALMPKPIAVAFARARGALGQGQSLRLRLNIRPPELARLPWELLFDPDERTYLAVQRTTSIVRFLDSLHPVSSLNVDGPLQVLHVQASPKDLHPLDLEAGAEVLRKALGAQAEIVHLPQATPVQLRTTLRDHSFHILHFDGHGWFDEDDDEGSIFLANEDEQFYALSSSELAAYLSGTDVRLVMLAACESGRGPDHRSFAGIAQHLTHTSNLPAVVAMQFAIEDQSATVFMRGFYGSLAQGNPVDMAMADGRLAIMTMLAAREPDWASPLLVMRTIDGNLWKRPPIKLPCPYPGMIPFREKDRTHFYGRTREVESLRDKLRLHPLITVIGPSGSGKSSLVFAGLIPALRESGLFGPGKWLVLHMRPGTSPMDRLAQLLQGDLTLLDEVCAQRLATEPEAERLLLVIDQFEELFTQAAQSQPFLDTLMALVQLPKVYLVLTVRADFLGQLMESSMWQTIQEHRLEVLPLKAEGLRQAIVQPAHAIGGEVDLTLVERLVADSKGQPGILPLLQETLVLLWDRQEGSHLSAAAYESLGDGAQNGIQVALSHHADAAFASLTPEQQLMAQRIFVRLVQFGIGRSPTRRQQSMDALLSVGDEESDFEKTIEHLTQKRLLTLDTDQGKPKVDLAHEALIDGWSKFGDWLKAWEEVEQTRRRLEEKAREWIRLDGEGGFLDGVELDEVKRWLEEPLAKVVGYSQQVIELIEASRKVINPGWHPQGVFGLGAGVLSLAGLVGLLFLYLQTTTLPLSTEMMTWIAVLFVFTTAIVVLAISRRSDSFLFQRLSHHIPLHRSGYGTITVLAITTIILWMTAGREINAIHSDCNTLGYTRQQPINIAISYEGIQIDAEKRIFEHELIKHGEGISAKPLQESDIKRCKFLLTHRLSITREADDERKQARYTAVITDISGSEIYPLVSSKEPDGSCMTGHLAVQVMEELGFTSIDINDTDLPPVNCDSYWNNISGYNHLMEGNHAVAKDRFLEAIRQSQDPETGLSKYTIAYSNLGQAYYETGDAQKAIENLKTAFEISPNMSLIAHKLADAYYRAGPWYYDLAEDYNLKAIELDSTNLLAHNQLATVYIKQKNYELAQTKLEDNEKRLEVNTPLGHKQEIYKNYGILAFNDKDYTEARRQFEKALDLDLVAKLQENFILRLLSRSMEKLTRVDSRSEEIIYHLAILEGIVGDKKQACHRWQQYIQMPRSYSFEEEMRREVADKRRDSCLKNE